MGKHRALHLFPTHLFHSLPPAQLPPHLHITNLHNGNKLYLSSVLNYWKRASPCKTHIPKEHAVVVLQQHHSARRSGRIQSFHGHFWWGGGTWRQGNHEKLTPYTGQHKSLYSVSKKKIRMEIARRTRHKGWPVRSIQWKNHDHFDIQSTSTDEKHIVCQEVTQGRNQKGKLKS